MSTAAPPEPATSRVQARLAQNKLGALSLWFFGTGAATPLTVLVGVTVGFAIMQNSTIPLAYIIIGGCLALFAVGYLKMARRITNAGAFYAFVSRGIGRPVGVGTAWIAAASYCALQVSLYGVLGLTASGLATRGGIDLPWWAAAGAAWLLIALMGTRAIDVNAKFLAVLLVVEIGIILIFTAANFGNAADGIPLSPLSVTTMIDGGAGAVLALAFIGFVGFESPTVYGEEAKDRHRTVAVATIGIIVVLMLLYVAASWSMVTAVGEDRVVEAAVADDGLLFSLAAAQLPGGTAWIVIGETLLLTSVTAAALSFHNTTARYLFSLGREQVLPGGLGQTSARSSAPVAASVTQSVIAGLVLLIWLAADLDPLVHLFYFMGTSSGIGLLVSLSTCAIAVLVYFLRDRRGEPGWVVWGTAPAAVVAMIGVLWLSIDHFPTLLGVDESSLLPQLVPWIAVGLGLLGIGWGLCLKALRPQVYGGIGHGADASLLQHDTADATAEVPRV